MECFHKQTFHKQNKMIEPNTTDQQKLTPKPLPVENVKQEESKKQPNLIESDPFAVD